MSKPNGTRALALANQFKQQTARVIAEKYRAEVKLPIPTIAPDFVFEFVAQRVDITSLLYNGALPETFAKQMLGARREARNEDEITQEFLDESSAEEKQAALDFQIKLAQEVCYAPKLVFHEPESDEEIDLRTLPFSGNLIIALFNYAMGLSPDVPVAMTNGDATTVGAVSTFPDGASGNELSGAVAKSAAVRRDAKRAAQDRG